VTLQNNIENRFWPNLKEGICQILLTTPSSWHESQCHFAIDKQGGDVILYPEAGLLLVYATQRQHREIADLTKDITQSAKRQVLIEATILEVELNEGYEAGVDWSLLMQNGIKAGTHFVTNHLAHAPFIFFPHSGSNPLQGLIKALEVFGHTRVLSSPRIMALNNQTAVLKIVNEEVYFTLQLKEDLNRHGEMQQRKFESQLHTVPVGLIMSVTPQIAEEKLISLHVRPSITSIGAYKEDPAVSLYAAAQKAPIKSQVPILQIREFDSMLSIPDQHVAILGGLIKDDQYLEQKQIPLLSRLPGLNWLFRYQHQRKKKSELVLLLRPQIVAYDMPEYHATHLIHSENR
jgi:general secretion pathway protein D